MTGTLQKSWEGNTSLFFEMNRSLLKRHSYTEIYDVFFALEVLVPGYNL